MDSSSSAFVSGEYHDENICCTSSPAFAPVLPLALALAFAFAAAGVVAAAAAAAAAAGDETSSPCDGGAAEAGRDGVARRAG